MRRTTPSMLVKFIAIAVTLASLWSMFNRGSHPNASEHNFQSRVVIGNGRQTATNQVKVTEPQWRIQSETAFEKHFADQSRLSLASRSENAGLAAVGNRVAEANQRIITARLLEKAETVIKIRMPLNDTQVNFPKPATKAGSAVLTLARLIHLPYMGATQPKNLILTDPDSLSDLNSQPDYYLESSGYYRTPLFSENSKTVPVRGYYRDNGTYVQPYTRSAPGYGSKHK